MQEAPLNEHDAAKRLGLSVRTLRKWRLTGGGPRFLKLGRSVRYPVDELGAFMAAGLRTSTSDPGPG